MSIAPDALTALLRARLDGGLTCTAVERGPVGNGQETWFVDAAGAAGDVRRLVLRRSAPDGALPWTSRRHEFAVLRALGPTPVPVPAVHWCEDAASELGRPYLVMDRVDGSPPRDAGERAAAGAQIGRWLARLHALDPGALGLKDVEGGGEQAARAELGRWRERYARERLDALPLLGALLAWLETAVPAEPAPVVLLWGDPGPHNVLLEGGRVAALLDWELSHLGHPLDDLGAACWTCADRQDRAALIDAYEHERGAPVDRDALRWFEALACVSRSVMLLAGVRAYVEGRTADPVLAGLGLHLPAANLARAAALAGWPQPAGHPAAPEPAAPGAGSLRPAAPELADGVARFLEADVLPATGDRHRRRALKTAAGLLRAAAVGARSAPGADAARAAATAALLERLAAAGVPVQGGLEDVAARVERDPALARWRDPVRRHLLADLAAQRALLGPLDDLYGARPR